MPLPSTEDTIRADLIRTAKTAIDCDRDEYTFVDHRKIGAERLLAICAEVAAERKQAVIPIIKAADAKEVTVYVFSTAEFGGDSWQYFSGEVIDEADVRRAVRTALAAAPNDKWVEAVICNVHDLMPEEMRAGVGLSAWYGVPGIKIRQVQLDDTIVFVCTRV